MSDPALSAVDRAKVELMRGLVLAIKAKFENSSQAAHQLGFYDPSVVYRLRSLNHKEHSLAWLIQTLDKVGAKVSFTIDFEKPKVSEDVLNLNNLKLPKQNSLRN